MPTMRRINEMSEVVWTDRVESFARIRAQIRQVLATNNESMDFAEIAVEFKLRFRYLPSIERRLRELVQSGADKRIGGSIPTYELV